MTYQPTGDEFYSTSLPASKAGRRLWHETQQAAEQAALKEVAEPDAILFADAVAKDGHL